MKVPFHSISSLGLDLCEPYENKTRLDNDNVCNQQKLWALYLDIKTYINSTGHQSALSAVLSRSMDNCLSATFQTSLDDKINLFKFWTNYDGVKNILC